MKTIVTMICGIALLVSSALPCFAASWWYGSVYKVENYPNGAVKLQMDPSTTQIPTPDYRGKLRIDPDAIGANQMLATILTAISLNKEISVYTDGEPDSVHTELIRGIVLVNE